MKHKRIRELFKKKPKLIDKIKEHKKPILIGLGAFVVILVGVFLFSLFRSDDKVERTDPTGSGETLAPTIVFEPSPLTGLEVSPELAKLPVISVVVENSPDARPQSGLDKAGVVFEALVEGGITRFLGLFQESLPDRIGPIRSLRPYFIDMGMGFDAGVAHVGGSPQALAEIKSLGGRDLDQFASGGSFYRSNDRFAPHNMYTSGENMANLMKAKGFTSSSFAVWPRKEAAPLEVPTASSISIEPSSFLYGVDYLYDATSNTYERLVGDQQHKDNETTKQLSPNVVIAIKAAYSVVDGDGHLAIDLVGSGEAWVFQDGGVTKGQWNKSSRTTNISFVDSAGAKIELNPGQTWITIIPLDKSVSYTP